MKSLFCNEEKRSKILCRFSDKTKLTEQIDCLFAWADFVGGLADIVAVLFLLDSDDAQNRNGDLVDGGGVRDKVVTIIVDLLAILVPNNGRSRVAFHFALQLNVIVQCLSDLGAWCFDNRTEFHFEADRSLIRFTDAVVSLAIVQSAIFLVHFGDLQDVAAGMGRVVKFSLAMKLEESSYLNVWPPAGRMAS